MHKINIKATDLVANILCAPGQRVYLLNEMSELFK